MIAAELATQILTLARKKDLKITTAESCTGGMISAALTDIAGSSDVFDRGFVTYSNEAKHEMLGVPETVLAEHGAVSSQTACAMAEGALRNSNAGIALSVTGIAGPGGGSEDKPVGTVWFAVAVRGHTNAVLHRFHDEGRNSIRAKAARTGLVLILEVLTG